jgi:TolA-binding protein
LLSSLLLALGAAMPSRAVVWPFVSREEARSDALLSGRAAMEDEIYDLARKELEKAFDKSETVDEKLEVAILLARSHRSSGNYDQAKVVMDKIADVAAQGSLYPEYLSELAYLQFDLADYAGALASLTTAVDSLPEQIAIANARLLPKVYVKLGRREESLAAYAAFNSKYPTSPEAPANLLEWAGVLAQAKRLEEAVEILRQLADMYTDSREAYTAGVWEAQLLSRLERWDEAAELLGALLADQNCPVELRAEAHFYLARVHEERRDIDAALEQLSKIEELGLPDEALQQGRVFRGKLLFISGREEEGLEVVHAAMRARPDDMSVAATQLEMANMLIEQERPEEALREYQYYLETFADPPGKADALLGRAWALYQLEDYVESALAFRRAMEALPEGALRLEALYKCADSYFRAGQYAEALDIYNIGVSMYSDSELHPSLLFQSAETLRRLERSDEALERLAQLESRYPQHELARKALVKAARIEEERGEWNSALEKYSAIAERYAGTPLEGEALHNRAIIHYRLSRFAHAIEDFEALVEQGGDSEIVQRAFFMRGWCYYLIGEQERGLDICRQFLEKYPESIWAGDVNFWIGNHFFNKGDFAEAETVFATMAEEYPDGDMGDSALFWAAQSALKRNEYLRAIDYLGRLLKLYPQSAKLDEARFAQGDALAALGKFSEAILVFEEILKNRRAGRSGDYFGMRAWGRIGDCHFTLGSDNPDRYQQAISSYDKIVIDSAAPVTLKLQAEFKIGRSLEKLERPADAFERYMIVVYDHLKERKRGEAGDPLWFTKAAFAAAQIAEARQEWRQALNIYQRVIDADVAAAPEAQKRIRKIRLDHWILF